MHAAPPCGPDNLCTLAPPGVAPAAAAAAAAAAATAVAAAQAAKNRLLGGAERDRCARADAELRGWTTALFACHLPVHHEHLSCYDVQYCLIYTISTACRQFVTTAFDCSGGERRLEYRNKFQREMATLSGLARTFQCLLHRMTHDETGIYFHGLMDSLLYALRSVHEPHDIVKHGDALRKLTLEF